MRMFTWSFASFVFMSIFLGLARILFERQSRPIFAPISGFDWNYHKQNDKKCDLDHHVLCTYHFKVSSTTKAKLRVERQPPVQLWQLLSDSEETHESWAYSQSQKFSAHRLFLPRDAWPFLMVLELGMLLRCFCDALVMLFDAFAMLFWRSCDALGKI